MSEYEPWQEAAMEYAESVAENIRKIFSIINEEEKKFIWKITTS